jgi:hypothetical protein
MVCLRKPEEDAVVYVNKIHVFDYRPGKDGPSIRQFLIREIQTNPESKLNSFYRTILLELYDHIEHRLAANRAIDDAAR